MRDIKIKVTSITFKDNKKKFTEKFTDLNLEFEIEDNEKTRTIDWIVGSNLADMLNNIDEKYNNYEIIYFEYKQIK